MRLFRTILPFVGCLLMVMTVMAQSHQDSLVNVYHELRTDTLRIVTSLEIAKNYREAGNYKEAFNWNEKGRQMSVALDDWPLIKQSFSDWAFLFQRKGEFSEAAAIFDSLARIAWKFEDMNTAARMQLQQGMMLRRSGQFGEATRSLLEAKSNFEKLGESLLEGDTELQLGIVHDLTQAFDEALAYYQRSLSMYLSVGDKSRLARAYQMLGANFYHREDFEKSIEYLIKSSELITNPRGLSVSLGNIANSYIRLGKFREALNYYQRSLTIKERFNDIPGMALLNSNIGNCYSELDQYELARKHIDKGIEMALEMQSPYIYQNALHQLFKMEQRAKHFKEAYLAFEKFQMITDSLVNNQQLIEINQLKAEYAFQQEKDSIYHESEVRQLALEQEASLQQRTLVSVYVGLAGLFIAMVIAVYILRSKVRSERKLTRLNRTVRRQHEHLAALNRVKTRFFTIIAHDLRGPLTTFLGYYEMMLDQLQNRLQSEADQHLNRLTENIHTSAAHILALLDSLVNWAMKEEGALIYEPEALNLNDCFEEAMSLLEQQALEKQISVTVEVEAKTSVWADRNSLMTVIRNLLNNALKFTPEGGRVVLSGKQQGNKVELGVRDNGVGIPREKLAMIYQIQEQKSSVGTNGESGSGLGLNIVHDFVKMNKGTIQVQSIEGEGTSFKIGLPMG